jgi:hypothetical protein
MFIKMLMLAVAIAAASVLGVPVTRTSAAQGTLRVDPATQSVGSGAEFNVTILQNADVTTLGAQASLRFDPAVLEIVTVQAGAPYAEAQLLLSGSAEEAIAEANQTGLLRCAATFFVPGSGSIPAGDAEFLVIKMRAKAGGSVPLALVGDGCGNANDSRMEMLDENGSNIPVTGTDGSVTVSGAAPPPPGPTAAASATPAGTPTVAIGTITPRTPVSEGTPNGSGVTAVATNDGNATPGEEAPYAVFIDPESIDVEKDASFTVNVNYRSDVPLSGAAVQVNFDQRVLAVEGIEPATAWAEATGAEESTLEALVEQANTPSETNAGSIEAVLLLSGESIPAGTGPLMTLKLRSSDKDARAILRFVSAELTGEDGTALTTDYQNGFGEVTVGNGGATSSRQTALTLGGLALLALGGTAGGARYMIQRRRKQWAS